jgi:hypothetical protein
LYEDQYEKKTIDYTFFLYNESHDRTIIFKLPTVMISNCTNINKAKNNFTPAIFEGRKDYKNWKSMSYLGTGTTLWQR